MDLSITSYHYKPSLTERRCAVGQSEGMLYEELLPSRLKDIPALRTYRILTISTVTSELILWYSSLAIDAYDILTITDMKTKTPPMAAKLMSCGIERGLASLPLGAACPSRPGSTDGPGPRPWGPQASCHWD